MKIIISISMNLVFQKTIKEICIVLLHMLFIKEFKIFCDAGAQDHVHLWLCVCVDEWMYECMYMCIGVCMYNFLKITELFLKVWHRAPWWLLGRDNETVALMGSCHCEKWRCQQWAEVLSKMFSLYVGS